MVHSTPGAVAPLTRRAIMFGIHPPISSLAPAKAASFLISLRAISYADSKPCVGLRRGTVAGVTKSDDKRKHEWLIRKSRPSYRKTPIES